MQSTLLQQGFDLMVFGMGTVFVFLALLVVGTTIMSSLVNKYFFEETAEDIPTQPVAPAQGSQVNAKTLEIIQQAIYQHRAK